MNKKKCKRIITIILFLLWLVVAILFYLFLFFYFKTLWINFFYTRLQCHIVAITIEKNHKNQERALFNLNYHFMGENINAICYNTINASYQSHNITNFLLEKHIFKNTNQLCFIDQRTPSTSYLSIAIDFIINPQILIYVQLSIIFAFFLNLLIPSIILIYLCANCYNHNRSRQNQTIEEYDYSSNDLGQFIEINMNGN